MPQPSSQPRPRPKSNIIFIHPDLGIGGAERLILDAALSLQSRGHKVAIYTSHRDKGHCFEEARDGTLDVRVRGNTIFPPHLCGRFFVLMAVLRQVHLVGYIISERIWGQGEGQVNANTEENQNEIEDEEEEDEDEEVFIIDQMPACAPVLKLFRSAMSATITTTAGPRTQTSSEINNVRLRKQRTLFYCHFPDQLLSRRDEGGWLIRMVKGLYRYPFDWFEGWAMGAADRVVVNSRFTRGMVSRVFGNDDVGVVYPCVDTKNGKKEEEEEENTTLWGGLKILLSINRFERKKNIELAIRAYHGLTKNERRRTRLVLAGGYDNRVHENVQYHKELESLATSLGFQTATSKTVVSALSIPDSVNILFLLSVPSAFKQTLLSSASLLLYTPSHEHFGIVPVEAMHAGLPVLADKTGGPLETIVEAETGWLRDVNDLSDWTGVIRWVLWEMAPDELKEMGRRGKERVEREFSLSAMGDRLEGEIGEMLNADGRAFMSVQQVLGWLVFVVGIMVAVFLGLILRR